MRSVRRSRGFRSTWKSTLTLLSALASRGASFGGLGLHAPDEISPLVAALEQAALQKNVEAIRFKLEDLAEYLDRVELDYAGSSG